MEPPQSPSNPIATPATQTAGPGQLTAGTSVAGQPPVVRKSRWRRMRQILVVGLCALALLCAGAAAAGALYYDRATKPDLSTPDHVTRKYLEAYLEDRDEATAKIYQCGDGSGLAAIHALRDDYDSRGKRYGVTFAYSIEGLQEVNRTANDATLSFLVVVSTTEQGRPLREVEHWQATAHNDNGWRVCTARETD